MKPNEENHRDLLETQVRNAANSIPSGRVANYGALGARCEPPISGYICGRVMNSLDGVPWWRIVAKDGSLSIAKRNPQLAREQRELLETEGVEFDGAGRVEMERFLMDW